MKRLSIKVIKGWVLVSRKGKEEGMNGIMADKGASLLLAASQSEILNVFHYIHVKKRPFPK